MKRTVNTNEVFMLFHKTSSIAVLFVLLWWVVLFEYGYAKTNVMTIAMPEDVIHHSIQDILPMKIDEASQYIAGRLYLNSISKLVMGDNSAVIEGVLIGKDLSVITKVGDQDLRFKVGNLYLPLTCDLDFRFDALAKTLYVRPRLRPPKPGSLSDMENSVMSLLAVFNNKEYPISLTSLQTMNVMVGDQDISVHMEPVDIRVAKGELIVKMVPKLSKTN